MERLETTRTAKREEVKKRRFNKWDIIIVILVFLTYVTWKFNGGWDKITLKNTIAGIIATIFIVAAYYFWNRPAKTKKGKDIDRLLSVGVILLLFIIAWNYNGLRPSGINGWTQSQFEDEFRTMSNGKIDINDSEISQIKGDIALYMARWNGFKISAKVQNNHLVLPFMVITPPVGQMNEILIRQYEELTQDLVGIADPQLSVEDRQLIIQNSLDFNNQVQNGTDNNTLKNGISYELKGGENPESFLFFMALESK
ncbi:hypothetical protein [Neobacillus sp. Marseille-QA0830]